MKSRGNGIVKYLLVFLSEKFIPCRWSFITLPPAKMPF